MVGRPGSGMGRDGQGVFVYFNNDGDGNAVRNARTLRALPVSGRCQPSGCARGQHGLAFRASRRAHLKHQEHVPDLRQMSALRRASLSR